MEGREGGGGSQGGGGVVTGGEVGFDERAEGRGEVEGLEDRVGVAEWRGEEWSRGVGR